MPTITPSLVPLVAPGNLFKYLTAENTVAVRWFTAQDPNYYEVFNRPIADVTLRQLILAKTLDQLSLSIGHQAMFPFLVQARVSDGTEVVDVPPGWIWDIHMSTPAKWENFRLAKIKRISGVNDTNGQTGVLRLIFTAEQENSNTEVAIFYADYRIDSTLTYQRQRLTVITSAEENIVIEPGESETIEGFITLRTLDQTDPIVETFLLLLAPPSDATDANADGFFDDVAVYELVDSVPGGINVTDDFDSTAISHGTGLLVDSAQNTIPSLDSDTQSWINSFNYPFDSNASRTSETTSNIEIPLGLFREFDMVVPAGDEPTGDTSGTYFPVWITRIQSLDSGDKLRIYFATHNVTDESPSVAAVEFARLDLLRTMVSGDIVAIEPIEDLQLQAGSDQYLFQQGFGKGHVVLSGVWSAGTSTVIDDFFDSIEGIADNEAVFSAASTRLSSYGLSRVPKYTPTIGQAQALKGTSDRLTSPIPPSDSNRFVSEQDQGLGNQIDLENISGIDPSEAIERYGYTGALVHRTVKLCIDQTKVPTGTGTEATTFYAEEILPRLKVLFGRSPKFGDWWYNGTQLLFHNGDSWQSV